MDHVALLPHHEEMLFEQSGIDPGVARERGYRSIDDRGELRALGFGHEQSKLGPSLLVPIRDVRGEVVLNQIRADSPRANAEGKIRKYEFPPKSEMRLDIPFRVREQMGDPAVRLWITEGAKKVDAMVSRGECCIALAGVWNWRGKNYFGGKAALADWEFIAVNDREVYVVFDSDVMVKGPVRQALNRLVGMLESRGARVRCIYLYDAEDGTDG